jgi:hypothetical protein
MSSYAGSLTIRDAREAYFAANQLGTGGYEARWVRMKIGPIPFAFPNTPGRVRAVKLHDIHHVLTEYDTSWRGEAQIAAWEIASGCGRRLAAWVLNLWAMAIGLVIAPRAVAAAFQRGCGAHNLYAHEFSPTLLDRRVDSLRTELSVDGPPRPGARAALVAWSALALSSVLALVASVILPVLLAVHLLAG